MSKIDTMTNDEVQEQLKELYNALDAENLKKAKLYEYTSKQLSAVNEVLDGLGAPEELNGKYLSPAARLTYWISNGCEKTTA